MLVFCLSRKNRKMKISLDSLPGTFLYFGLDRKVIKDQCWVSDLPATKSLAGLQQAGAED
jgi:hypothetical protein